jgi:hypothetical protein
MRLRSRIAWLAVGLFLSTAVSAYAQAKPAQPGPYPPPPPPYPRFEVTGTYQVLTVQEPACDTDCTEVFPFGLNLDGAINTSKAFGVAGEIGWATKSLDEDGVDVRLHVWNIGAGPRFNGRPMGGRVWPFAQVLVGAELVRASGESDTHLMIQPGGGVNIIAGDGWGVVLGADYRRTFLDEEEFGESGRNAFRFVAGIRVLLD